MGVHSRIYDSINVLHILICVIGFASFTDAYATGAGASACTSLRPGHGSPSGEASPFTIEVLNNVNMYKTGTPIQVRVSGDTFQGLFIQARASDGPKGTWTAPDETTNTKLMQCSNSDDTVTHANINEKTSVTLTWNPPAGDVGNITFTGVVAKEKLSWWNDLRSSDVTFDESTNNENNENTTVDPGNAASTGTPVVAILLTLLAVNVFIEHFIL